MLSTDDVSVLMDLGFTPYFQQQYLSHELQTELAPGQPERVVLEQRSGYGLLGIRGMRHAVLAGRLRHTLSPGERPCVGDWVLATPETNPTVITHVFERASLFSRKAAGDSSNQQPIAANVDLAFIVSALTEEVADPHATRHSLNVRRLERYLRAVAEAKVRAVVVINKADLREDTVAIAADLRKDLGAIEVVLVSAVTGTGLPELAEHLGRGETGVFVGSSGVGKSSLINRLLGHDAQRIESVRDSDTRGRHTTTHRELFRLPAGGLLIDTPGMREFAPFSEEAVATARTGFEDIDTLASSCRFRDCSHQNEPGCAVRAAIDRGELALARVENANRLQRELRWQRERTNARSKQEARKRHKALSKQIRARQRDKD